MTEHMGNIEPPVEPAAGSAAEAARAGACAAVVLLAEARQAAAAAILRKAEELRGSYELPPAATTEDVFADAVHRVWDLQQRTNDQRVLDELQLLTNPKGYAEAHCQTCRSDVSIWGLELENLGNCPLTGGCELAWRQQHPSLYDAEARDPDKVTNGLVWKVEAGARRPSRPPEVLPCAGDRCSALLALYDDSGKLRTITNEADVVVGDPRIIVGECGVDVAGRAWRKDGIRTLNAMQGLQPGDEVDGNDGERLSRSELDRMAVAYRSGGTDLQHESTPPAASQQPGQNPGEPPSGE